MKVTINDELTVEWEHIGEGLQGDFDPDDPHDEPLLRFDVTITEEAAERYEVFGEPGMEGWFVPDSTSYCTQVSADLPGEKQLLLLAEIAAIFYNAMVGSGSLKKTGERLSWTSELGVTPHGTR